MKIKVFGARCNRGWKKRHVGKIGRGWVDLVNGNVPFSGQIRALPPNFEDVICCMYTNSFSAGLNEFRYFYTGILVCTEEWRGNENASLQNFWNNSHITGTKFVLRSLSYLGREKERSTSKTTKL